MHVGEDPEGFPTEQIAIYYSEKTKGAKWHITSCYPYTLAYDSLFCAQRTSFY